MTHSTRLYLLTPPRIDIPAFAQSFKQVADAVDVAVLQLRLKDMSEADMLRAAETLLPLCHARDALLLVNDSPELAVKAGADGVHIGADDMPYNKARAIMGNEHAIGVSCYDSTHLAMEAGEAGADYVAFGAFFASPTKQSRGTPSLEMLQSWLELTTIPTVAIGGITPDNCAPLIEAGVDFIATLSAIWHADDSPHAAAKRFATLLNRTH